MPTFEFNIQAKITIRMNGETPEQATSNLETLLEDYYMEIPCQGHEIRFGDYPATVWADGSKPVITRKLSENVDPKKSTRMSMAEYIKMCLGDEDEE